MDFLKQKGMYSDQNFFQVDPGGPINNIPALVQIMAWCRPGDKSLSEPMMVILLMHICVTQPQRVNTSGWNKMAHTLQMTYSNSFSCMKIVLY